MTDAEGTGADPEGFVEGVDTVDLDHGIPGNPEPLPDGDADRQEPTLVNDQDDDDA